MGYLILLIIFGWLYSKVGAVVFWTLIGLWFLMKISGKKKSKSKSRRAQKDVDEIDWYSRAVEKLGEPEEIAAKANTPAKIKRLEERASAREDKADYASDNAYERLCAEQEVLEDAADYAREAWNDVVVSFQISIDCNLSTPTEALLLDGLIINLDEVGKFEAKLDALECSYCFDEVLRGECPEPPNPLLEEIKRVRAILDSNDNNISAAQKLAGSFKPTQKFSEEYLHDSFTSFSVDQWLFALLSSEPCGLSDEVLLKLFAKGVRTAEELQELSGAEIGDFYGVGPVTVQRFREYKSSAR
jgi:hypothetical protein